MGLYLSYIDGQPAESGLLHYRQHCGGAVSRADCPCGGRQHHAGDPAAGSPDDRHQCGRGDHHQPVLWPKERGADAEGLCEQPVSGAVPVGRDDGDGPDLLRYHPAVDGDPGGPPAGSHCLSGDQFHHHDLPLDVLFVFQCIPGFGRQPDSAVLPDRLRSEQYWPGRAVCGCVPLGSGRVCLGHGTGAGPVGGGGGGAAVPQISHDADAAAGPPAPWKAAAADHGAGHSHCGAVCLQQSGQSGGTECRQSVRRGHHGGLHCRQPHRNAGPDAGGDHRFLPQRLCLPEPWSRQAAAHPARGTSLPAAVSGSQHRAGSVSAALRPPDGGAVPRRAVCGDPDCGAAVSADHGGAGDPGRCDAGVSAGAPRR